MRVSAINEIIFNNSQHKKAEVNNQPESETFEEVPEPRLPKRVSLWKRVWYVLKYGDESNTEKADRLNTLI